MILIKIILIKKKDAYYIPQNNLYTKIYEVRKISKMLKSFNIL